MKTSKFQICLIAAAVGLFIALNSCSKENVAPSVNEEVTTPQNDGTVSNTVTSRNPAIQIDGIAYYVADDECNSNVPNEGATYAIMMTGDLVGCLYIFVEDFECSPSGTYREEGIEHFVGWYNGIYGEFWTAYKFEAMYEGCSEDGYVGLEIFGRCQHPVIEGSGIGVFDGVKGRLDMKDDIEAGNYPYRGHLKF